MVEPAHWTAKAEAELEEIGYYIAVEDSRPDTARKVLEAIRLAADSYSAAPNLGQRHPDLLDGWLYFRHKRWLIVFAPSDHSVDILRVLDATRDLPRLFGNTP